MADPSDRFEKNAEGRYYVDESCIYCDLCCQISPAMFSEDKKSGLAYVFRQPDTEDEHYLANEALEGCPTASIGDIERPGIENVNLWWSESQVEPGESKKRWWHIWK